MPISDVEYEARQAADRAYKRMRFDAEEKKRDRDVARAQTAEMAALRETLERLLALLTPAEGVLDRGDPAKSSGSGGSA